MSFIYNLLGLAFLAALTTGCATSFPVGTNKGKVASRYAGGGLYVISQPGSGKVVSQKTHTVVKGETLWAIAQNYSTSVDALKELNSISDVSSLSIGQILIVAPGAPEQIASASESADTSKTDKPAKRKHSTKKYPLKWPAEGTITARYGRRRGKPHDGIDIGAALGSNVRAAAAGVVVFSDRHGGYGNLIVIRHKSGLVTVYAHNRKNIATKGQSVQAGDVIAEVGDSGRSTGPHLHFEVRRGANPQNPLRFLPPN